MSKRVKSKSLSNKFVSNSMKISTNNNILRYILFIYLLYLSTNQTDDKQIIIITTLTSNDFNSIQFNSKTNNKKMN